jgi:hypothetical protein
MWPDIIVYRYKSCTSNVYVVKETWNKTGILYETVHNIKAHIYIPEGQYQVWYQVGKKSFYLLFI